MLIKACRVAVCIAFVFGHLVVTSAQALTGSSVCKREKLSIAYKQRQVVEHTKLLRVLHDKF